MGVDALMFVSSNQSYSDRELIRVSYEAGDMFPGLFFFGADDTKRALRRVTDKEDEDDEGYRTEGLPDARTLLEFSLSCRYYGENYERGPAADITGLAEWIEWRLPGCAAWYGGDSADVVERFDSAARERLKQHWFANGHRPYLGAMGRRDDVGVKDCPRCLEPPTQFGFGGAGRYGMYKCLGCDFKATTKDGGKTWVYGGSDD